MRRYAPFNCAIRQLYLAIGAIRFALELGIFQNPCMNIGKVIRAIRTERGQSLETVALDVGTDASNLSRIERGLQQPSEDALRGIAAALKSSVAELYALAEGETLAKSRSTTGLQPADLVKDAVQMRKYFRSLTPEYQKVALELVKTLARVQQKS
jgi:transcriptional regulator with XRE-family HTH domain